MTYSRNHILPNAKRSNALLVVKNIFNYKDLSELNIEYILPYWKTAKICFDYSVTPKMIAQNYENYEKY